MRALYEDKLSYSCDHFTFRVVAVEMGDPGGTVATTSKRTLYFRIMGETGAPDAEYWCHIYGFKTKTEAIADLTYPFDKDEAGVVVYKENVDLSGWPIDPPAIAPYQAISMDNNAPVAPNMSGLVLRIQGYGQADEEWDAVYGYTDSPALDVIEKVESLLEEYTGAGEALADFTVGQIKRGNLEQKARHRRIVVGLDEDREIEDQHRDFGIDCGLVIQVGVLDAKDSGFEAFELSAKYAAVVRSILHDERTSLDGMVTQTKIRAIGLPEQADESSGAYYVCTIRASAFLIGKLHSDA